MDNTIDINNPEEIESYINETYRLLHDQPESVQSRIDSILSLDAGNPSAHDLMACLLYEQGDYQAAFVWQQQTLRLAPWHAHYYFHYGVMAKKLGRDSVAIMAFKSCLRLDPKHGGAMWEYAEILRLNEHYHEAIKWLEMCLQLGEEYSTIYSCLAICYSELSASSEKVISLFDKELARTSDTEYKNMISYLTSMSLLSYGDFKKGWQWYEKRYQFSLSSHVDITSFPYSKWCGEWLKGKTILVHGEQGLGDEMMFASILPKLIDEGANIILATHPFLCRLFQDSFKSIRVLPHIVTHNPLDIALLDTIQEKTGTLIDYQIPVCSLAHYRGPQSENDFPTQNYLQVDPVKKEYFTTKLQQLCGIESDTKRSKLKVGLMWNANLNADSYSLRGRKKSVPIHNLKPLQDFNDQIDFISLQNVQSASDAGNAPWLNLIDMHDDLMDFSDTAALVSCLDLVITVDTSVAHLSGGLGMTNWVLLKQSADWRWLRNNSTTSYWYKSTQLIRQTEDDDWQPVVQSVCQKLSEFVKSQSSKKT